MSIDLTNHYFLTSSSEIDGLIQPLKDFFGITSFVYQKNFFDGSEIRLSNQPEWVDYFFKKQLYKKSVFEHDPSQYQQSRILWASLPQHQPVLSKAREFNIDHGITFIEPQADGCEFFFIGTTPRQPEVATRYLSHLDLLECFLQYFKEQAASLIKKAVKQRIVIPDKISKAVTPLAQLSIDKEAFLHTLLSKNTKPFSLRELDCVRLLLRGYNLKMIATELQLSYRTVETHVMHIKQKSNCHTKADLIRYLNQQMIS